MFEYSKIKIIIWRKYQNDWLHTTCSKKTYLLQRSLKATRKIKKAPLNDNARAQSSSVILLTINSSVSSINYQTRGQPSSSSSSPASIISISSNSTSPQFLSKTSLHLTILQPADINFSHLPSPYVGLWDLQSTHRFGSQEDMQPSHLSTRGRWCTVEGWGDRRGVKVTYSKI